MPRVSAKGRFESRSDAYGTIDQPSRERSPHEVLTRLILPAELNSQTVQSNYRAACREPWLGLTLLSWSRTGWTRRVRTWPRLPDKSRTTPSCPIHRLFSKMTCSLSVPVEKVWKYHKLSDHIIVVILRQFYETRLKFRRLKPNQKIPGFGQGLAIYSLSTFKTLCFHSNASRQPQKR